MLRISLIGLVAVSTAAADIDSVSPYLSVSGGLSMLQDAELSSMGVDALDITFDEGYVVEAAAGITLDRGLDTLPLRLELALSYQANDLDEITDIQGVIGAPGTKYPADGTAEALALMLNGYMDFPTAYNFIPFVMAGIGGARIDYDIDDDGVLAGQVGGGVAYAISEVVTLDLKYKYFLTEKVDILNAAEVNASGHHLQLGVRVEF